jgi:hypothetical protein
MNEEEANSYMQFIQEIDIDRLESFTHRAMRELMLHDRGLTLLSNTAYDYNVDKIKFIDDEIRRRRVVE